MTNRTLSEPAVDLREAEGVWWITFNRPEASNAFTLADLDRVVEIFREAGDRPRAAIFTGAGIHRQGPKTAGGGSDRPFPTIAGSTDTALPVSPCRTPRSGSRRSRWGPSVCDIALLRPSWGGVALTAYS